MLDLALPKIECERAAESYARFRIEPLEPGYGYTMGNALRRVLLSSILSVDTISMPNPARPT